MGYDIGSPKSCEIINREKMVTRTDFDDDRSLILVPRLSGAVGEPRGLSEAVLFDAASKRSIAYLMRDSRGYLEAWFSKEVFGSMGEGGFKQFPFYVTEAADMAHAQRVPLGREFFDKLVDAMGKVYDGDVGSTNKPIHLQMERKLEDVCAYYERMRG